MNDNIVHKLSYYKMIDEELKIWENFCQAVHKNCITMEISKEYDNIISYRLEPSIYYTWNKGYNKEYGYYWVEFGDRGDLTLIIQTMIMEDFRWKILENIVTKIGQKIETENCSTYEKQWRYFTQRVNANHFEWIENKHGWIYNLKYDSRKYWFAYSIKCLSKVFRDTRLDNYIEERIGYMNRWFDIPHWGFDKEKMDFIEISDSQEHD